MKAIRVVLSAFVLLAAGYDDNFLLENLMPDQVTPFGPMPCSRHTIAK